MEQIIEQSSAYIRQRKLHSFIKWLRSSESKRQQPGAPRSSPAEHCPERVLSSNQASVGTFPLGWSSSKSWLRLIGNNFSLLWRSSHHLLSSLLWPTGLNGILQTALNDTPSLPREALNSQSPNIQGLFFSGRKRFSHFKACGLNLFRKGILLSLKK
jgi:hypothetical protein